MSKTGQPFAYGTFIVKPGKETEFTSAWEEFAKSTMSRYGTRELSVRLLQDTDNPRQFLASGPLRELCVYHPMAKFTRV
jgi:hypothetical protein